MRVKIETSSPIHLPAVAAVLLHALQQVDERLAFDRQPALRRDLYRLRDAIQKEARLLAFIFQIRVLLALRNLEERRLRDEQMSALDDFFHLPIKERQDQRADVRTVDIGVGHDDRLVIAQLGDIEVVYPDACAEGGDHQADFFGGEHLVQTRLLHVQDLALDRNDRLEAPIESLLR